jgi:transketolase
MPQALTDDGSGGDKQCRDLPARLPSRLPSRLPPGLPPCLPTGWDEDMPQFAPDAKGMATRVASGRNLHFGVREHAMGAIINGMAAQQQLLAQNIQARIVSMPSWELFEQQAQPYRDAVLPPGLKRRLAVEAGVAQGWHRYVGAQGAVLGIDDFGASATGGINLREYGLSVENVCRRALALLA